MRWVTTAARAMLLLSLLASIPREGPASAASCSLVLGFASFRERLGTAIVGDCLDDQFSTASGNAQQHTTGGLLTWRNADNWLAFSDGYQSWVDGPDGIRRRLNTERFPWELDDRPLPPGATGMLLAAGDIAGCEDPAIAQNAEATARLLETMPGTILALGDLAYEEGSAAEYATCYDPRWGRLKARTQPATGNHEYETPGAAGYFDYFGPIAGEPGAGYYSFDVGGWHIIALNSNCALIGGCRRGSPEEQWLRADLRTHPALCTLAYWHHPRFVSGRDGGSESVAGLWDALYEAGADVVLSGHEHFYERLTPLDPQGNLDLDRGIRSFVVGTGGRSHHEFDAILPASEVRDNQTFGVLALTLYPASYTWQFVPAGDSGFSDSGAGTCHR